MARSKWEGSAADKKADKKEATKRGESLKKWEGSASDRKMDKAAAKKKKR